MDMNESHRTAQNTRKYCRMMESDDRRQLQQTTENERKITMQS